MNLNQKRFRPEQTCCHSYKKKKNDVNKCDEKPNEPINLFSIKFRRKNCRKIERVNNFLKLIAKQIQPIPKEIDVV